MIKLPKVSKDVAVATKLERVKKLIVAAALGAGLIAGTAASASATVEKKPTYTAAAQSGQDSLLVRAVTPMLRPGEGLSEWVKMTACLIWGVPYYRYFTFP